MLKGAYPSDLLDDFGPLADAVQHGDLEHIAQPIDWIGINYYFDLLVRGLEPDDDAEPVRAYPTVTDVTESPTRPVHTDMGWPITPDGFTELLISLKDTYPNLPPVYITENGCAYDDPVVNGRCSDPRRIDYLNLHLRAILDAIDAGVDVRGYFQWSLMDNFEWALGYDKRFGLVHVDFDTHATHAARQRRLVQRRDPRQRHRRHAGLTRRPAWRTVGRWPSTRLPSPRPDPADGRSTDRTTRAEPHRSVSG